MDKISLERLALMHPAVRQDAIDCYNHINKNILGKGVRLRITHTLRTAKEQDDLYAFGRTVVNPDGKSAKLPFGKIKTRAKAWQSFHNYGLAFDVCILLDRNGDGVFEEVSWDTMADDDKDGIADWREVAAYLKSQGWTWGGDWAMFDAPHFEKVSGGYTERSLKTRLDQGKSISEVINGKTYNWVKI